MLGPLAYTSHDGPLYQLQNRGQASCGVRGYVDVRSYTSAGDRVRIRLTDGQTSIQGTHIPVKTVTLAPRAAAQFFFIALYGDSCVHPPAGRVDLWLPDGGGLLHAAAWGRAFCDDQDVSVSPIQAAAYVTPPPQ
jgi:hypothetical protein